MRRARDAYQRTGKSRRAYRIAIRCMLLGSAIGCAGQHRDYARIEPTIGPANAKKGPFAGLGFGKKNRGYLEATTTTDAPDALAVIDAPPGGVMTPVFNQQQSAIGQTSVAMGQQGRAPEPQQQYQVPPTVAPNPNIAGMANSSPQVANNFQQMPNYAYNSQPPLNQQPVMQAPTYDSQPVYGQQVAYNGGWQPVNPSAAATPYQPTNGMPINPYAPAVAGWQVNGQQPLPNNYGIMPNQAYATHSTGSTFIPSGTNYNSASANQIMAAWNGSPMPNQQVPQMAGAINDSQLLTRRINSDDIQAVINGSRPQPQNRSDELTPSGYDRRDDNGRRSREVKLPGPPDSGDKDTDDKLPSARNSDRGRSSGGVNDSFDVPSKRNNNGGGTKSNVPELEPPLPNGRSGSTQRSNDSNQGNESFIPREPPNFGGGKPKDRGSRTAPTQNEELPNPFDVKTAPNANGVKRQIDQERKEKPNLIDDSPFVPSKPPRLDGTTPRGNANELAPPGR